MSNSRQPSIIILFPFNRQRGSELDLKLADGLEQILQQNTPESVP